MSGLRLKIKNNNNNNSPCKLPGYDKPQGVVQLDPEASLNQTKLSSQKLKQLILSQFFFLDVEFCQKKKRFDIKQQQQQQKPSQIKTTNLQIILS